MKTLEEVHDNALCECCEAALGENEHTCPFREDVGGDCVTYCNCCHDCEEKCCADI